MKNMILFIFVIIFWVAVSFILGYKISSDRNIEKILADPIYTDNGGGYENTL